MRLLQFPVLFPLLASLIYAQELPVPEPIVLPPPLTEAGGATSGSISLELVSSKPNKITDDDEWWERNALEKPELYAKFPALTRGAIPQGAPGSYRGQPLRKAFQTAERRMFLYGASVYDSRYLLVGTADGRSIEFAFDARAYGTIAWAELVDGTLYLTNNPGNLSAADGGGARVFAVDLATNTIKWKSDEKTAHGPFVVAAGSIICAYGFTGEPDFIRVLSRFTGEVEQTLKLKTAAGWLIRKGDELHVRCYDEDRVYRIRVLD